MRRILITFMVLFSFLNFTIGQKFHLTGYVFEKGSGEKVIYATITDTASQKTILSNSQGFYSLEMNPGMHHLEIRCMGYEILEVSKHVSSDTLINFYLQPEIIGIDEVAITGKSKIAFQNNMINLPLKSIEKIPVLVGEKDLLKGLQLLPGVDAGAEGNSGIYVRGGDNDQNLILLDGVPVYHASHFQGFFSTFNSDALRNVYLYKDIPSRYGDRLSSVVDIYTREGNLQKWAGTVSVGVLTSRLLLEGPLKKDKTSILLAGRRTYLDLFSRDALFGMFNNNWTGYYFYDINTKIKHRFSDKLSLTFNLFNGLDHAESEVSKIYEFNSTFGVDETHSWENLQTSATADWLVSPSTISKISVYGMKFRFVNDRDQTGSFNDSQGENTNEQYAASFLTRILVSGITTRFETSLSGNNKLYYGIEYENSVFRPFTNIIHSINENEENSVDTALVNLKQQLQRTTGYVEYEWNLNEKIKLNYGIRLSLPMVVNSTKLSIGGNLSANYAYTNNLSFNGAYTRNYQYTHQLGLSSLEQTTDLWVPVTKDIHPAYADAISAGSTFDFQKLTFNVSAYYKKYHNLLAYRDGASYLLSVDNWTELVNLGKGQSYGIEFLLEKSTGKTTGWISYVLSKSERTFPQTNNGKTIPFSYDRRHSVKSCITREFGKKFNITAVWVYSSGHPVTAPIQKYNNGRVLVYSRDAYRLNAYHRLDLAFNYTMFHKRNAISTLSFGAYNVYNRKNPYKLDVIELPAWHNRVITYDIIESSLLPVLPYINYTFSF